MLYEIHSIALKFEKHQTTLKIPLSQFFMSHLLEMNILINQDVLGIFLTPRVEKQTKNISVLSTVVHTHNPRTQEAKAEES